MPHYGALDAICPETQFRLSHQSATGQGKLALGDRRAQEQDTRHAEAMRKFDDDRAASDQRHSEAMRALEALITRQVPGTA